MANISGRESFLWRDQLNTQPLQVGSSHCYSLGAGSSQMCGDHSGRWRASRSYWWLRVGCVNKMPQARPVCLCVRTGRTERRPSVVGRKQLCAGHNRATDQPTHRTDQASEPPHAHNYGGGGGGGQPANDNSVCLIIITERGPISVPLQHFY